MGEFHYGNGGRITISDLIERGTASRIYYELIYSECSLTTEGKKVSVDIYGIPGISSLIAEHAKTEYEQVLSISSVMQQVFRALDNR